MAEGMVQVLAEHQPKVVAMQVTCQCGWVKGWGSAFAAHQAEVLAANGYGKLESTKFVLAEREAELLNLKGPCRAPQCRLHHAHRGPCDTRRPE